MNKNFFFPSLNFFSKRTHSSKCKIKDCEMCKYLIKLQGLDNEKCPMEVNIERFNNNIAN